MFQLLQIVVKVNFHFLCTRIQMRRFYLEINYVHSIPQFLPFYFYVFTQFLTEGNICFLINDSRTIFEYTNLAHFTHKDHGRLSYGCMPSHRFAWEFFSDVSQHKMLTA